MVMMVVMVVMVIMVMVMMVTRIMVAAIKIWCPLFGCQRCQRGFDLFLTAMLHRRLLCVLCIFSPWGLSRENAHLLVGIWMWFYRKISFNIIYYRRSRFYHLCPKNTPFLCKILPMWQHRCLARGPLCPLIVCVGSTNSPKICSSPFSKVCQYKVEKGLKQSIHTTGTFRNISEGISVWTKLQRKNYLPRRPCDI